MAQRRMMPPRTTLGVRRPRHGAVVDDGGVARPPTDGRLAAAIAGDEAAFADLYRDLHPDLLRYLRVAAAGEAEDVAADVWLEVARGVRGFRGDEAGFRAWVFTIGRQRAIDHGRRQVRRPADLVADVPERAGGDDTAAAALDQLDAEWALAVVRRLPKDQADAVLLRVVAGFDVADTARILGKRPGAVRVNTMRGLRALARLVGDTSGDGEVPGDADGETGRDPPGPAGDGRPLAPRRSRSGTGV